MLEIFRMGIDTIKGHKLRSFLTALGILIGVSAVLMNVAMVEGLEYQFREEVLDIGGNLIQVQAEDEPGGEDRYFDEYDVRAMKNQPRVEGAAAYRTTGGVMERRGKREGILVRGVEDDYFDISDSTIVEGSGVSPTDDNSAVIDSQLAYHTFDRELGVRSTITVRFTTGNEEVKREFRITGISETENDFFVGIGGGVVNIPISTLNDIVDEEGYTTVEIYAESSEDVDTVKRNTMEIIDRQWGLEPVRGTGSATGGEDIDRRLEEREEYSIITAQEILDFTEEIKGTIALIFIGIASVSLLVGGIGIANIMLVTVKERTREIGVMKAVGAKNRHILMSFLFEAGLLGLLGGAVGLIVAVVAANTVLPMVIGIPGILPPVWIGISLGLSFLIGVLSGLYPAVNASKMDPVKALSYE